MATPRPGFRNQTPDELDKILNADDDVFNTSDYALQSAQRGPWPQTDDNADLGIDEEIKITKKRQPIPKLDEERLLSSAGIPKLQKITKERLRYKGKGHEYGDITRMLNIYQLWLDDLYPRAKFADALAIIEAQGHKRRMQVSRMAWIKESKPRIGPDSDEEPEEPISVQLPAGGAPASGEPIQDIQTVERDTSSTGQEGPPREAIQREAAPASTFNNDGPDEDELDALLAESDALHSMSAPLPQPPATEDDPFADEMEAMAEMEGMW